VPAAVRRHLLQPLDGLDVGAFQLALDRLGAIQQPSN
jgi:hypothetical protein